jgi:predicted ATP-binding protein involved in virulence
MGMRVHQLTMTGFRDAKSLPLELHDRLNVFFGMNGSGKSSILDATALLLSWLVNRIKHESSSGRPLQETDIRNGEASANIHITCNFRGSYFSWNLAKTRKGYSKKDAVSILLLTTLVAKQVQAEISKTNGLTNLPLIAYYPVNRAVLDIPLRIKERHSFDLLSAYSDSLKGGANFRAFFEWFREREDLENENRKYAEQSVKPEGYQFPDRQLEAVRAALMLFMPEFTNLTVRRNPLRMEVEKNGKTLRVNQLSDGEKCLMAMVGDLARRMAIANPVRSNPLEGEGIILIDEIDLHLHPKWQRLIVPKLREVFPNCQFIISTHSPHVITHVQPESLFLLIQTDVGIVAQRPTESYGKSVDRILEDLMGLETTRPDIISARLHDIYTAIDQAHFDEARRSIAEMKSEIGEDPELLKAEILIKRKEIIGK